VTTIGQFVNYYFNYILLKLMVCNAS